MDRWCGTHFKGVKSRNWSKVKQVERRATKLIPSIRNLSYSNRSRALILPSLEFRRDRGDAIYIDRFSMAW
jgi:hypothetical protein